MRLAVLSTRPDRACVPLSLLYSEYRGLKLPGRGADHLCPPSAEVKDRVIPSAPLLCLNPLAPEFYI